MSVFDDMLLDSAQRRVIDAVEKEIINQIGDNWHVWSAWPGSRAIAMAAVRAIKRELDQEGGR